MSSLRLALKQSLQETGHLIKEKKKKPAKNNKSSMSSGGSTKRRSHHPPDDLLPRKRGRPRKNVDEGGDNSQNTGLGGGPDERQSGTEGEASESENEFSYESGEEVDDSEEGEDDHGDGDDEEGGDEVDGHEEPADEKGHRDLGEPGQHSEESGHGTNGSLPAAAAASTGPASPDNENGISDEERRRQKKLFKKHLQQAANKIQAQWKKKAGLSTGEDSENERRISGESSGGLSPMRNRDTPSNSNSSTPNNAGTEKKKTKGSKAQTVPPPGMEVLEWNRALSEKKSKKHIASGMRVKVCFAAKVKRDGKVFKKKIWYGGRVSAVSKEGSKIRIKYDDGTSEISKFPDKDVVVDDTGNGEHLVSAHKFIPPPPRGEIKVDHADNMDHGDEVDPEPEMAIEEDRNEAKSVATTDVLVPTEKISDAGPGSDASNEGETRGMSEAFDCKPNESENVDLEVAEKGAASAENALTETKGGDVSPPKSPPTLIVSAIDAAGQAELLRELGSQEEGELSPGLSLISREKSTNIDLVITKNASIEEAKGTVDESPPFHADQSTNEPRAQSAPIRNVQVASKESTAPNERVGGSSSTPKLTIRISNVAAPKTPKPLDSDSEEELSADTPVTERKVKSIQLKRKPKRKREVESSIDDQPSKKKIGLKQNEDRSTDLDMAREQEGTNNKKVTTPKHFTELSALVDTPQPEEKHIDVAGMRKQNPVEPPLLPKLENKKDRAKSPTPTGVTSPVPSRSATPSQDAAEAAPALEEPLIPKLSSFVREDSLDDAKARTPVHDGSESDSLSRSKGLMDSLTGPRSGRKGPQQGKEIGTPKQDEKFEKKKKKRKRKEGEDEGELSDASVDDRQWVQCDSCAKWRILPSEVKVASLPKHWYCHLNTYDPKRNNCAAPEQTAKQAAKEWRKARKRAKLQRLAELQEVESTFENSQVLVKDEPMAPISPKSGKGKKIKRTSPIFTEESLSGPDAQKIDKKLKKGKPTQEVCDPLPAPEVDAPKKPGRKRGRPARNQTPQKENDGHDNVEWVQCEKCEKWRKLPPHVSADELPDTWYCKMNTWNPESASCNAPEDKADASHHEVSTFAGMFGAGAGKNSYRALIFGTGKKHNRPMSERARAAESLFMRPTEDTENPCPTVMYSSSSCFVPRTSNFTKASNIEEEKPPGVFDVLSNSEIFGELRGIGRPMHVTSSGAGNSSPKLPTFENTLDDVKLIMKEIVLRSLGDGILTGEELILTMHGFPWESLSLDFAVVRPYFNADIIINTLLSLVRDGVVEMTSFRDLKIPMGQWTPRYRKVRSLRAMKIEESIKASRCMKISKPWKQRDLGKASEWVTGVSAFP